MNSRPKSQKIFEDLCQVIPGGVNSPVRAFNGINDSPLVAEYAFEDQLIDADGKSYIDYCGSWGALIHGHAHPQIISAAQKRMAMGSSFGITTSIEEQLARKVTGHIDSVDKIRFVSSGTEATMSAVRLARGFTKRKIIIKFAGHYHGHADFFLVQAGSGVANLSPTASSAGIPEEIIKHTICLPFNDTHKSREQLNLLKNEIAAVILEPIAGNMGVVPADPEFMTMLREETEKIGALLIFDEVITGFRVSLKGAQHLYGIKPDLTTYGKIIGGGFPAAAFGGRADVMNHLAPLGTVYQAGTLSGNPVAMEAGLQSLLLLEQQGFYEELEKKTNLITAPVMECIQKHQLPCCLQKQGSMFTLFFGKKEVKNMDDARQLNSEAYKSFFYEMFIQGVYLPPLQMEACFVSSAHTDEHLSHTANLIVEFLTKYNF